MFDFISSMSVIFEILLDSDKKIETATLINLQQ